MVEMDYFLLDVTSLPDPGVERAALAGIPDWRRKQILRYLQPCDRKLCLGAWRLLENTLKTYGFSAQDVTVGRNGKLACEGIYFNLSHSADMALCAVSNVPVGCDIERVTSAPFDIAERVFSDEERHYISNARSARETDRRFFRLWTMKESYLKMTSEGMNLSPDRIEIAPCTLMVLRDGVSQSCTLQNRAVDDYEISICIDNKKRGKVSAFF